MFGIGGFELFLIIVFAFLILGPDKLPKIAKQIGRAIAKIKDTKDHMDTMIQDEIYGGDRLAKTDPISVLTQIGKDTEGGASSPDFAQKKAQYDSVLKEERHKAECKDESNLKDEPNIKQELEARATNSQIDEGK